jgi:hypothetical protein
MKNPSKNEKEILTLIHPEGEGVGKFPQKFIFSVTQ